MKGQCIRLSCILIFFLSIDSMQVKGWINQGYNYNHFCEVSFNVISSEIQQKYQYFHVIAQQPTLFAVQNNPYFIKSIDGRQSKQKLKDRCLVDSNESFYCIYSSNNPNSLQKFDFLERYNQTHISYTFRINKLYCASSHLQIMPIKVSLVRYPKNRTEIKIIAEKRIEINHSNLTYRQTPQIIFPKVNNFLVNCGLNYQITIPIYNNSYLHTWNYININFTNINNIVLNKQTCSITCQIIENTLRFINPNWNQTNKQFQLPNLDYNDEQISYINLNFKMQFIKIVQQFISISVISQKQSFISKVNGLPKIYKQYYGYNETKLYSYNRQQFQKISLENHTNNSCQQITIHISEYYFNQIILLILIIIGVLLMIFRKELWIFEKIIYILIILIEIIIKIIYINYQIHSQYKFIILGFLIGQIILNFIYFIKYLSYIIISTQFTYHLKKNFSLIFTIILLLINYKFYAIVIFKFVKNVNHVKVRFHNSNLYIIHAIHLSLNNLGVMFQIATLSFALKQPFQYPLRVIFLIIEIVNFMLIIIVFKSICSILRNRKIKNRLQNIRRISLQNNTNQINNQEINQKQQKQKDLAIEENPLPILTDPSQRCFQQNNIVLNKQFQQNDKQ